MIEQMERMAKEEHLRKEKARKKRGEALKAKLEVGSPRGDVLLLARACREAHVLGVGVSGVS